MGRGPTKSNENVYFVARKKAAMYNERLYSREGAAELLGISVSTLADYELGNTKVVPVDKVVLMADLYNAPELKTGYCKYESITKLEWVKDIGYLDFVRYWGYDIQGAIYQEIVYQNTGERLPFYIAAGTKEEEPNIEVIQVTQNYLDEAKHMVETNMPRILRVKNGEAEPDRCEMCDCCRHTKVLKRPISITNLVAGI